MSILMKIKYKNEKLRKSVEEQKMIETNMGSNIKKKYDEFLQYVSYVEKPEDLFLLIRGWKIKKLEGYNRKRWSVRLSQKYRLDFECVDDGEKCAMIIHQIHNHDGYKNR